MKKRKKKSMSDARLMLKVMEVCIQWQVVPGIDSPCHKRLRSIIRKTK